MTVDPCRSIRAILDYIDQVDPRTFILFALIAMLVKFVGVISSAYAWHLLLVGQGIRYPVLVPHHDRHF